MKRNWLHALRALLAVLIVAGLLHGTAVLAQRGIIHVVLFYSPSCGHCHYVITEVLPPLQEEYGDQLQLVGVDVTQTGGQALYQAAVIRFNIPEDMRGVPALIIDDTVLVGSVDIPEQLPGLLEHYQTAGGVDWPDIPGFADALAASDEAANEDGAAAETSASIEPEELLAAETSVPDDLMSRIQRDPAGNALAIILLAGMLVALGSVVVRMWRREQLATQAELNGWRAWAVALLCLVGLGVSIYLAYVETTNTTAVCGPIGDCNTVQQSPYAMLFGLIPIGVLGVVGNIAMLVAWAGTQWGQGQTRRMALTTLLALALFGTLFSIYLTFLEPFVIGATCAWCLTSAVSMTLILLLVAGALFVRPVPPVQEAPA
ncbi:MAG: vitamin K epoxide reductase [Anaerolineae bacterium]|nr:vitamin K epoxide reductase [Anaerolineae bacterium]MCA9907243.1 vitamin K epoxide reductase [Anaerolineae bacterium]